MDIRWFIALHFIATESQNITIVYNVFSISLHYVVISINLHHISKGGGGYFFIYLNGQNSSIFMLPIRVLDTYFSFMFHRNPLCTR